MPNSQSRRKPSSVSSMPAAGQLLLFSDQQQDRIIVSDVNICASSFIRLGMKEAEFKDSSFTQSNFEDCYFRKAIFKNVRFTGSIFRFCNFDKVSFQACDFRYCSFFNCKIPKDEIISCLPPEPNLRRDLTLNLRANSEMIGDKKAADTFLDIEIKSTEAELKAIFLSNTEYYRKHYNLLDQVKAGTKFLGSKISGLIWGYGHRVGRLFISYIVITCLWALMAYFSRVPYAISNLNIQHPLTLWESIYIAFGQTVGLAGLAYAPVTLLGNIISISESFLGTLYLALLAATLYRRIAR
jgi:hypothetical protein